MARIKKSQGILERRTDRVKKRELNDIVRLSNQGLSDVEIARKLKRDPRTVRKYLGKTLMGNIGPILRLCLTNLYLNRPTRYVRYPLELGGYDFRLDPITWFHLCTPDLSQEYEAHWEKAFPSFIKRLRRSDFWRDYLKLESEVYKLQKDYEEAADILEGELRIIWDDIQHERNSYFRPSRIPLNPEPELIEWAPQHGRDDVDKAINIFTGSIAGLHDRLCYLEELLQQLNDDLP